MSKRSKLLIASFAPAIGAFLWITSNYVLLVNATGSLGNWAFIVKKGVIPTKVGEYIAFMPPVNPYYNNKPFIKIIGGVAGEEVNADENRVFSVSGRLIGKAKDVSVTGDALLPGPTGIIPEHHYFVYSPKKDSYDSRYHQIGWISEDRVVGTAIPVL